MTKSTQQIVVEQIGSPIGRPERQRRTLLGLGLTRIGRRRGVEEMPAGGGMTREGGDLGNVAEAKAVDGT